MRDQSTDTSAPDSENATHAWAGNDSFSSHGRARRHPGIAQASIATDQASPDFRLLFQSAPGRYVVLAPDLTIVAASAAYLRATMTRRDEIVGRGLFAVLRSDRDGATSEVHLRESLGRVLAHRMTDGMNSPVLGGDGEIAYIIHRVEEVAATTLLADRLASAVETIEAAFALFDGEDRLVLCNGVYRRLIGDSLPGPIAGKAYEDLLDAWIAEIDFAGDDERARFRSERLSRRRHDQTATFDVRMRDGRSLRVVDRRTTEGGIVTTIWDLTDDVRLAKELRDTQEAAEVASVAKSDFLSSMSHELRTPMNAILGFAQLLQGDKKEPLSDRHKERVAQILKGGEHLLRLIDDMLDLSRIEAGGVSISTEPLSVLDLLDEVRTTLEPIAAQQGILVEIETLSAERPMVAADRTRLLQILINFGSNAIKYNRPSGNVAFIVSAPDSARVRVTVRDTGLGIPADKQDKLFQPFQRAGQETGPIEGTGIGLLITKRLARLMHGDVGFRSALGEGSEFWVDLPIHELGQQSGAEPAALDAVPRRLGADGRKRILYVEDNPANLAFMKDLVSTFENIDLIAAPSAEMGIELARLRHPDAIIMDINLPGMSGLDALRVLRQAPETKEIPVIAVTAAASERDRQRGTQAGFYRYLTKPVRVTELVAALEALLVSLP